MRDVVTDDAPARGRTSRGWNDGRKEYLPCFLRPYHPVELAEDIATGNGVPSLEGTSASTVYQQERGFEHLGVNPGGHQTAGRQHHGLRPHWQLISP